MNRRSFIKKSCIFIGSITIGSIAAKEVRADSLEVLNPEDQFPPDTPVDHVLDGWASLTGIQRKPFESDIKLRQRIVSCISGIKE